MNNKSVLKNFIWRYAERCGAQGVAFIVSIVLARLLDPAAYGTVALMIVFTTIMQVVVDSGLGTALVQKKDADDVDFSTVFYVNIILCVLLYILLFVCAPYIANYYNDYEMTAYIRVLGITVIIAGVKGVQQSYVSKTMQFKRFFFATLGGTLTAGVVGVVVALNGGGVWAIIAQHIVNVFIDTCILWISVKWRPKAVFSFERLKELFGFGWKMLASGLINTIYTELRALIIGKFYSASDLAFYNQGNRFPYLVISNINNSIDSVLLPTMSNVQDEKERVKSMVRKSIKICTYVMAPILIGLAVTGEPIVKLVLTEKWLPAVFYMRIFCVTYLFYPIHTANLNAITSLGRSDIFLKLEVCKKIVGLVAIFVTMRLSVRAMAYSLLFTSVASQIINSWPNKKLLNYGYLEQLKDISPGILLAVAMGGCIMPIQLLNLPDIVTLLIQVPLGATIYIVLSKVFKLDSFEYLWNIVKPIVKKVIHR